MDITIRHIEPGDVSSVVDLIREFAEFENLTQYCEITEARLATTLFGDDAVAQGILALDGDRSIGYALFFPSFSSFRGQRGFYLDDIYVNERYRGSGVGHAMLKHIARFAAARGFERIDFLVLDWNTRAAEFYLKLGAVRNDHERHFKLTDDAFRRLAS